MGLNTVAGSTMIQLPEADAASADHPPAAAGPTSAVRQASVLRYREKRRTRLFSKKIRYEVRKLNAERRPRMKVATPSIHSTTSVCSLPPFLFIHTPSSLTRVCRFRGASSRGLPWTDATNWASSLILLAILVVTRICTHI